MNNTGEKVPDQIIDFQPDALEIKNQKLPKRIAFGVWLPFIILVIAIVWACLAKTDVVVRGNGKLVTDFPASIPDLTAAKPVLEKFAGWKQSIKECGSYAKLPKNARTYVEFIESFTNTPVGIVSVGADRNQTFFRQKIWSK